MNIALRNRKIENDRLRVTGDKRKLPVFVYAYEFDMRDMAELNVKRFESADREWLRFVVQKQYYFGTSKSAGLLKFKGRNELN